MTLADAHRIFKHWERFPPVRRLVAAAIGFKPPELVDKSKHLTLEEFQAMLSAGMGKGSNLLQG